MLLLTLEILLVKIWIVKDMYCISIKESKQLANYLNLQVEAH